MKPSISTLKLTVIGAMSLLAATTSLVERIGIRPVAASVPTETEVTLDTTKPVEEISAPAGGWNFRNHVIPALTKMGCNSGACHGSAAGKGGFKLTLRGYDPELDYAVISRQSLGRRANKVEPARSLILLKPTMAIGHGGGKRMEAGSLEYKVISEWIAAGLPAPSESDPQIASLEVSPREATLGSGGERQLNVKARYSDGHVEDVTRWVKYETADSSVATVDDKGLVKVQASGEAAITLWYQSRVAFARVANPFPHVINPEVFARSPRHNYIDDLALRKLRTLRIAPSEQATDREFIRRAFLDAAGILPAPQEAERFVAAAAADKRARLIDSLLEREDFVDYWVTRWSDLLLVSQGSRVTRAKLSSGAMWNFHDWIRESVRRNKPWDRFVREIVTASGNTLENGAANYYVLHKEPTDLTENFSAAFLGMSLTCARCHNHPMEKWTQKQYYEMANLFGRIGLKNGARPGDIQVYSKPDGEVNHPRSGKPLAPRPLDGEALALEAPKDRRAHLAEWLTSSANPFFARAVINRVWKNFMGRGLVEAVDDMRATNPPSNEELMAALEKDFVARGFDLKHLIRTIMNSAAYQRSSRANETNQQDDRYYSRYIIKRLPAEALLDALAQVTGAPTEFPGYPPGTRAMQLPEPVNSYFLQIFGKPPRVLTVESERSSAPSVTQALHVINGATLNQKLRAPGGVVETFVKLGVSDEMLIDHIYLAALSRRPSKEETAKLLALMDSGKDDGARRQAIEDIVWGVLTSKEFLFNH